MVNKSVLLFLLISLLFLFSSTYTVAVKTPCLFSGIENNKIAVITSTGKLLIPLEPETFTAIMGHQYGRLVLPEDFPAGLNVELFITPQGTVRAMRNKLNIFFLPEGRILPGWGHSASLSPDGKHYFIYNLASGLFLYSLSSDKPPLFLSNSAFAVWNKDGSKIVYPSGEHLIIYDIDKKKKLYIPLKKSMEESELIITDRDWNYSEDK